MLLPLPAVPYAAVLRLERCVSHEGTVSVGGNLYSVTATARRFAATVPHKPQMLIL